LEHVVSHSSKPDVADTLDRLKASLGPQGWVDQPRAMEPYLVEERGLYHGAARLIARPSSTDEVAAIVRLCAEAGMPIYPQGGNTGLCGGGVPWEDGTGIVLSMGRMNRVRSIDPLNFTLIAEAGCILADIQQRAADADRLFPLSLGSEGSCQIGGNLSTNAGGIAVLRYGSMRDLVLGLEVVLADGRVWDGLTALRKDNTGYDLKQLFIGGEGTLGIVTAATLKLFPRPRDVETALLGLRRVEDAMALFARARAATADQLTGFELMPRRGLQFALDHVPGLRDPLTSLHPWYVLLQISSSQARSGLRQGLEAFLAEALEAGLIDDGVIAENSTQSRDFWRLREGLVEAQKAEGGSIKHDVSVPVSRVAAFIEAATEAVEARIPGARPVAFGHVGDGNVHFNISQPVGADKAAFLARWAEINHLVHDIVAEFGGSISAEHGIGRLKRDELAHYKPAVALDLMYRIKAALDPAGIMNPGKVLPPA
jgi:D-lactate dehydrogenase (cytochrome)